MENKKKVAFYTLGCKLNFSETSTIARDFQNEGFERVDFEEIADIYVINTCSVTDNADKQFKQIVKKAMKLNDKAFVAAVGCYAQLKPEEVASIEGVDLVLGAEQKLDIVSYLNDFKKKNEGGAIVASKTKDIKTFSPSCSADDRTRHFLQVQDGCDYFCTYCTIPFARGRSRNGSIASIVKQAEEVASKGGKEIVLTGVNIGDFGRTTGETFLDLIKALDEVEGIVRYRISSIEPNLITDEAIHFVAQSKRFAPHFHIPLQSGNDEVLRLMKRKYDTSLFRHKVSKIKELLPNAFIGVDVIVGTRGETDELFEDARVFIEGLDISQLHVFSYSERPGTQALKIDHSVDPKIKHTRSQQLLDLSERKLHAFYEANIGKEQVVLFEEAKHGDVMHGFTANYIKVEAPYRKELVNETRRVLLNDYNEDKTALTVTIIE